MSWSFMHKVQKCWVGCEYELGKEYDYCSDTGDEKTLGITSSGRWMSNSQMMESRDHAGGRAGPQLRPP